MEHLHPNGGDAPDLATHDRHQHSSVSLAPLGTAAAVPGGLSLPEKNETRAAGGGTGFDGQNTEGDVDCAGPTAQHAADIIEGEEYARAWLTRMRAGTAQPGELAVIVAFLADEMLHGACRVIEKALGVCHA